VDAPAEALAEVPVEAPAEKAPAETPAVESPESANGAVETAVAPEPSGSASLQPPSTPVELAEEPKAEQTRMEERRGTHRDKIVTSLNIAKLQAMQMSELNHMARDLGVENFGTMRKHEVIFHILQKNAERAGVLFSEGVLEVLPEGFGFLRSQSFNYLPCPEDIYVSPSQIRRFDLQTGNLIAGQSVRRRKRKNFSRCSKSRAWMLKTRTRRRKKPISTILRRCSPTSGSFWKPPLTN